MIQRLNADQTRQIVKDLVKQGLADYKIPEPMFPEIVESFCAKLAASSVGRSYGWFDDKLVPHGIFAGVIVKDPMTGVLHGMEHIWWVAPKYRGKPSLELLKAFESECLKAGCVRVTLGISPFASPDRTKKLYRKLGYSEYSVAMSKKL